MATITTRAGKGSPLTNNEVDANFTNLNTDKAETDGATLTNVDVNSGAIDGTTIGATTPSTGDFTTLTENDSPAVVQSDIGTDPDEIPLNQYLGKLAYQDIPYLDEDERPIVPLTTPSVQDVIDALLALQLIKQED